MLFHVYCLLLFLTIYLSYLFIFFLLRHYFRLVNSSFCHVLVRGGDTILTIIMYICFVHFRFSGNYLQINVYCIRLVFF